MQMKYTEADFEHVSWHDCHFWGLDLRVGDPDEDDWTSNLVLDIDFITDWICPVEGGGQFRVAPATLAFHGVTDPRDRKSTRLNSSHGYISYAVFCLKKKKYNIDLASCVHYWLGVEVVTI